MKEKIIIYSNENCPYCSRVKEVLLKNNIKFEDRATNKFEEEFKQISSLTGMNTVPIVYYKENYFISGRDYPTPEFLVNIINNYEKSNYSIELQTLERMKTLNYNMGTAFGRIDQILKQIENKINTNEHESTN